MCPTDLDADQVIKAVYDEPANRLRVDAAVTATFGDLDVTIRSDEDSVTIGNESGTEFAEVTSNSELKVKDDALDDTNNLLFGIDSTLTTLNSKFTSGTDIGDVTVNNAGGASAVNIQDGGNSITVDGTVTANAGTGNFTVVQPTGTNLHMVVDSGTITTITNVVHIDDNGGSITVDGTVAATQSGTWNINDITGTIALPTGASTSANQTTINNSIQALQVTQGSTTSGELGPLVQGAVTTTAPTYVTGQTNPLSLTTAGALRVDGSAITQPVSGTITANQGTSPWVVSGTVTTSPNVNVHDGAGVSISSTGSSLDVNVTNTIPVSQSGSWTVTANPITFASPQHVIVDSGTITVSNLPTTLDTNYGTVGASTLRTAAEIGNATGAALFGAGTTTAQVLRVVLPTDQTAIPVTQSGTWVLGANSGVDIGDVTINNTAGAGAVNIQDGGNSITVDGTVIVTATDLDIRNLSASQDNVAISDGTDTLAVNIDGSINITDNGGSLTVDATNLDIRDLVFATDKVDVSGSVIALDSTTLAALESITVQNGAGASAVNIQDGGNSITVDGPLTDAQLRASPVTVTGTVTAAGTQDVNLIQVAGNTVLTGNGATGNGSQRVTIADDNSAITVKQATGTNLHVVLDSGTLSTITNVVHIDDNGGSITVDGTVAISNFPATVAVTQSTSPWVVSGTVTANAGTNLNTSLLALESGGNLATIKTNTDNLALAQASSTSGQKGNLVLTATTTAAPSYTTATSNPLSTTTTGNLRVDGSSVTQPISAVSLPLPTGAATSALQTQPGVDIGDVTVNNAAGASAVNIQDGGNSITVDGTVTVTQGTSPWVVSGTVTTSISNDTNYGVVGANTLRTAAQIGNATGAANFNAGATGAQTLRTSANLSDGAGTALTSTVFNSKQSLDVRANDGFSTASNTRVGVTNASTQLLAANLNRRYVHIMNQTGSVIYIKLGAAAVMNQGIRLANNETYELTLDKLWTGTINAITNAGTQTVDIFEGT